MGLTDLIALSTGGNIMSNSPTQCVGLAMAIDIRLWDREEERYLDWLERAQFFINCCTSRVYKYNKYVYYGGNSLTNVSDRYEIRIMPKEK